MNSTALILTGLGWPKKAAKIVAIEKLMLSICACTNLSLEEVAEKTKGQNLDVVLKAAAVTGECLSYEDAQRIQLGNMLIANSPKSSAASCKKLINSMMQQHHRQRKQILSDRAKHFWQNRDDNTRRS